MNKQIITYLILDYNNHTLRFCVFKNFFDKVMDEICVILNISKSKYYIQNKDDYTTQKFGGYKLYAKMAYNSQLSNYVNICIKAVYDDKITTKDEELIKVYNFINTYNKKLNYESPKLNYNTLKPNDEPPEICYL